MTTTERKECPSLSGKIIPAHFVRMVDADPPPRTVPVALAPSGSKATGKEPAIKLIKEGDTVKSIEIHCTCGEVIRLDCEY